MHGHAHNAACGGRASVRRVIVEFDRRKGGGADLRTCQCVFVGGRARSTGKDATDAERNRVLDAEASDKVQQRHCRGRPAEPVARHSRMGHKVTGHKGLASKNAASPLMPPPPMPPPLATARRKKRTPKVRASRPCRHSSALSEATAQRPQSATRGDGVGGGGAGGAQHRDRLQGLVTACQALAAGNRACKLRVLAARWTPAPEATRPSPIKCRPPSTAGSRGD